MKDMYQRTIFFKSLMLMKGLPINRPAASVRKGGPMGYHCKGTKRTLKGIAQTKGRRVHILFGKEEEKLK